MVGLPSTPVSRPDGEYTAFVEEGWSGTVTPTLFGWTFDPVSRSYTDVQADDPCENYTATYVGAYTIAGKVTLDGEAMGGVLMSGLPGTPVTDPNNPNEGYSVVVEGGWSGTVVPYKPCYDATPTQRVYNNVQMDYLAEDYTLTAAPEFVYNEQWLSGGFLIGEPRWGGWATVMRTPSPEWEWHLSAPEGSRAYVRTSWDGPPEPRPEGQQIGALFCEGAEGGPGTEEVVLTWNGMPPDHTYRYGSVTFAYADGYGNGSVGSVRLINVDPDANDVRTIAIDLPFTSRHEDPCTYMVEMSANGTDLILPSDGINAVYADYGFITVGWDNVTSEVKVRAWNEMASSEITPVRTVTMTTPGLVINEVALTANNSYFRPDPSTYGGRCEINIGWEGITFTGGPALPLCPSWGPPLMPGDTTGDCRTDLSDLPGVDDMDLATLNQLAAEFLDCVPGMYGQPCD